MKNRLVDGGAGFTVSLKNVSYQPSIALNRAVLRDITLDIEPSSIVAVVGQNGAGKSSLLRIIAGEIVATGGTVQVNGQWISRPINRDIERVGIVHQTEAADLIDHLTIAQNVCIRQLLGGGHRPRIFATPESWRREIAGSLPTELTKDAGGADLGMFVGTLSGGQKQVLSVCIAVNFEHEQNPCRLLLLDEHTARLDHRNAKDVMSYTIREVKRSRATTIMVTHRYADAIEHADRIVVLKDGKVLRDATRGAITTVEQLATIVEGNNG